jgi:hypothetical protein
MPACDHLFRHRLGSIALGVLAVFQRLEGTRHHGLELAQHGVEPLELGQGPGVAPPTLGM